MNSIQRFLITSSLMLFGIHPLHPNRPTARLFYITIIFELLMVTRFTVLSLLSPNTTVTLLLGDLFHVWGDRRLWLASTLFGTSLPLSLLLVNHYYRKYNWNDYITACQPFPEFVSKSQYNTNFYKSLVVSACGIQCWSMIVSLGFALFAMFIDDQFSSEFFPLLVSSLWCYMMVPCGLLFAATLSTVAIANEVVCSLLRNDFDMILLRLDASYYSMLIPKVTLVAFEKACRNLDKYNAHWKRLLFVTVVGNTIFMGLGIQVCMYTKLPLMLKVGGVIASLQFAALVSIVILCPANVEAKARACHAKFYSLFVKRYYRSRHLVITTSFTIKRFQAPIAFSLWNSNTLDYMDFLSVRF